MAESRSSEIFKELGANPEGSGVQWIPLLALLKEIEHQSILFVGSPKQPFDRRELVWTSAIGKGGQAVAKMVTVLGATAVSKQFKAPETSAANVPNPRVIFQELAILAHASFNNIATITKLLAIDKNYSFNYFSALIELAEDRSLKEYLTSHPNISETEAQRMCSQVLQALQYLHSEEVLHNDIKTENILISREGAKLADFGHAIFNFKSQTRRSLRRQNRLIGTRRWAAPEFYDFPDFDGPISVVSDLYSFGFVVAALAKGFEVFPECSENMLTEWKCNDLILTKLDFPRSHWTYPILQQTLRLQASARFQSVDQILSLLGPNE